MPPSAQNGRSARLLMNLILLRWGYPPVTIPPESRDVYHSALESAQVRRDNRPYNRFMGDCLNEALDRYLEMLRRGAVR